MFSERQIAIIGVGNILYRDEGVGVHAVHRLEASDLPDRVSIFDAGTAALDSFLDARNAEKIIIIDAVRAGGTPGDVYRIPFEEIDSADAAAQTSLHQLSLIESIRLARLTLDSMPEVVLIGVEPESTGMGSDMSSEIEKKLEKILEVVVKEAELED